MIQLNIKKALNKHHLRQVDLINATGKNKTYINLIVNGTKYPSMDFFLEIVNKLNIPPKDFFEKVDDSLIANQQQIGHDILKDAQL